MTSFPEAGKHGFVFGLAGFSGSGKTTLAEKLISALCQRGFSVASIKHAHHAFDADTPGKDSWRHRKAGATQMIVSSSLRRVKFTETPDGDSKTSEEGEKTGGDKTKEDDKSASEKK